MSASLEALRLELQSFRRDFGGIKHELSRYTAAVNSAITGCPDGLWRVGIDYLLTKAEQRQYSLSFIPALTEPAQVLRVWRTKETATNLVPNPGFETAGAGGEDVFASWVEYVMDGSLDDETTIVHAGSHACKLTAGAGLTTRVVAQVSSVTPGQPYALIFYTRGDGIYEGRYSIWDNTGKAFIKEYTDTGIPGQAYDRVACAFTAPSGCTEIHFRLRCGSTSGAIVYYDDVCLYALAAGDELGRWIMLKNQEIFLVFDEDPPEADRLLLIEYRAPHSELSGDTDTTELDKEWLLARAMTRLLLEADPLIEPPELIHQQLTYWDGLRQNRERELLGQMPHPAPRFRSTPWGNYV